MKSSTTEVEARWNELRGPTLIVLDHTIETVCNVIEKYVTDSRGPSVGFVAPLADVVKVLMEARRLA